jgi:hypothetical protein
MLLWPSIASLRASENLSLESEIYVFKQSDFHEIEIPGATMAADGHALVFESPASARFDRLTLSLEGAHVAWGVGRSPPEQFSLIAAPPSVPITLGIPVTMTSSSSIQYLEKLTNEQLQVREIPADSPEAPHIRLTFTAKSDENAIDGLLLACDMDIATVSARNNIPGVALNVGKPVVTPFKEDLKVPLRQGQWAGLLLKAPNGSDYSVLMLLKLAQPSLPNSTLGGASVPEGYTGPLVDSGGTPRLGPRTQVTRTESVERPRLSVSAANYSQLSDEQLYTELHAPSELITKAPAIHQPITIHHYLLLPGEVYPNEVPMDTVYHEVALVLEKRGYLDAEFEKRAGHAPAAIDYLLRVHYGKLQWLLPTVRGDRITWGNDGLVANKYNMGLISVPQRDPRVGLTPDELMRMRSFVGALLSGSWNVGPQGNQFQTQYEQLLDSWWQSDNGEGHNFYLIAVEAFKYDEVVKMDKKAPCVWAVFIAVPVEGGLKFSDVLRGMLQAATPYFEETTHGLQISEVPPGKVNIGNPKVVP